MQPIPPGASSALPQGSSGWSKASTQISQNADSAIMATVAQWRALQQNDTLGFSAYASFILAHPGWPGEDRMRQLAEAGINPVSFAPIQVTDFFAKFPPRTATGFARYALALSALGKMGEAKVQAKSAWRAGSLAPADEAQMLSVFGGSLFPDDHAARADALLWQRNFAAAERLLASIPAGIRPVIDARIAMQRGASDAAMKMQAAEVYADGDPGYLADKVAWLRDTGNPDLSRSLLAQRHSLTKRPFNAEKWFELLLSSARGAASAGQSQLAYSIASKVDDAYDPTVEVRDRPLGERDDYTSLVWLAGSTAYYQLGRPRDAVSMFDRYATAARSPQTISKGYYWAGRAALMANDAGLANRHFTNAASYPDQFHGQLALERLRQPVPAPAVAAAGVSISDAEREIFCQPLGRARRKGARPQWPVAGPEPVPARHRSVRLDRSGTRSRI